MDLHKVSTASLESIHLNAQQQTHRCPTVRPETTQTHRQSNDSQAFAQALAEKKERIAQLEKQISVD